MIKSYQIRSIYNASDIGIRCFKTLSSVKSPVSAPITTNPNRSKLDISTRLVISSPPEKTENQYITHPTFPHPPFKDKDCEAVHFVHRPPTTMGDRIADASVKACRSMFDFVTGYKKPKDANGTLQNWEGTRYFMTEEKWLTRVIFLESVAGVPGMVAAFIRHLHSLRLLKRDKAWIETLLDEAYNERMHLLTFMKIGDPSWVTKLIIYVGQGVFVNLFFMFYLLKPRYCHRFVGYLEEEAVSTYTHLIKDIDTKKLPKFNDIKIPEISWLYWTDLNEKSTFRDLVLRVRADESKHREVNHTLANLDQKKDRNPFSLKVEDIPKEKQPDEYDLKSPNPVGWTRDQLRL